MQEILDQIADIDLVVNFKCTDLLVKHMGNGPASSSFQELLSVKNSQSNLDFQKLDNQLQSSSAGAEVSLKERLISYAEQVSHLFAIFYSFLGAFLGLLSM